MSDMQQAISDRPVEQLYQILDELVAMNSEITQRIDQVAGEIERQRIEEAAEKVLCHRKAAGN
jgi:hypothetical protein